MRAGLLLRLRSPFARRVLFGIGDINVAIDLLHIEGRKPSGRAGSVKRAGRQRGSSSRLHAKKLFGISTQDLCPIFAA
jgi:hypothetical protein